MATGKRTDRAVVYRSQTVGANTVSNSRGHFINVFLDGVPAYTLGPYEERLTLPQALTLVATDLRLRDALGGFLRSSS